MKTLNTLLVAFLVSVSLLAIPVASSAATLPNTAISTSYGVHWNPGGFGN